MDDRVKVLESVTKEMMKALKGTESPSLSFTAYAIQQDNIATALEAWQKLNG